MLKVTVPSCSASSCSSVTASAAPGTASLVPDYWIDGSNRDALSDFFEVESELGRCIPRHTNPRKPNQMKDN
uniref:Uncharacterized protein n=1 Tax=Rhinopithecus roxellana TaxID=61622 RepID=A0A2K6QKR1_RHIRO